MRVQLYTYKGSTYSLVGMGTQDCILREWPWDDSGAVTFAPIGEVEEGEMVEVAPKNPNYQPTTSQQPANYQAAASQRPANGQPTATAKPANGQPTATAKAANCQPQSLQFAPDWDALGHYIAHLDVVQVVTAAELWADSQKYASWQEVVTHDATVPRPVARKANNLLGRNHSRDFYAQLLAIHHIAEQARPVWFVEMFERLVCNLIDRYI